MAVAKVVINGSVKMDVTSDTVTENRLLYGETATRADGVGIVGAYVPSGLQEKTVVPTESEQYVVPDSGYTGFWKVGVEGIPSTYVGGAIPRVASQMYVPGVNSYVISAGQFLSGEQTIEGDENLVDSNIKDGVTIFGVSGVYGSGGGGSDPLADVVARKAYSEDTSVVFPEVSGIGAYFFAGFQMSSLTTVSFPKCTWVGDYAFYSNTKISSVFLPVCSSIGERAFFSCKGLRSISMPMCRYIGSTAFFGCGYLENVDLRLCSYIGPVAFRACSYSFSWVKIWNSCYIDTYAFSECYVLMSLYLFSQSISIANEYVFASTPLSMSTLYIGIGSIYMPASLLAEYKVAAGWSLYSERMVGLTDEQVEALR